MVMSQRPRLSLTVYAQLEAYAEFKADFHNMSIHARHDLKKMWYKLPYLVSDVDA